MTQHLGPYPVHPACSALPMLDEESLQALAEDIRTNGQLRPCVVSTSGSFIDGRNRWRACEIAGVEPDVIEREFASDLEVARYVWSENVARRHLTTSQRAMAAGRLLPMLEVDGGRRRDAAASELGVSSRTVGHARRVIEDGAPELVEAVDAGTIAVSRASELARLPVEEQRTAIARPTSPREALTSSETVEHYTPSDYIEAARRCMGGIDLDPASCERANTVVRATRYYTEADDGLAQPWTGRVFLNPPYGKRGAESVAGLFLGRLHDQVGTGGVEAAVFVVNASPAQNWFSKWVWSADAVCFVYDRIRFLSSDDLQPQTQPTQANVIGYIGPDVDAFAREFAPFGFVVPTGMCREFAVGAMADDGIGGAA